MEKFVVGSRGSLLAVTQTKWVIAKLKEREPGLDIELKIIKTTGDMDQRTRLDQFDGLGVFVKELRLALLRGEIDCAVHSLKDVPDNEPAELVLASFPAREDPRDVFISKGVRFIDVPPGAKVGTGSPRRIMQLRQLRGDLEFIPLRGNLDTRIRKMHEGQFHGIVVAAAGVKRLGRSAEISEYFTLDRMTPAIGQGCLTLECRSSDDKSIHTARSINDRPSETAVLQERKFMALVGGGCKVPMACHAHMSEGVFHMQAVMGDMKSRKISRFEKKSPLYQMAELAEILSRDILEDCRIMGIPVPGDLPENHLLE